MSVIARNVEDVGGVVAGNIVKNGTTVSDCFITDTLNDVPIGIAIEDEPTVGVPVQIVTSGNAVVYTDYAFSAGEFAIAGADGKAVPESQITDGTEMNVVGYFEADGNSGENEVLVPIMVQIGKRVRRNTETKTGTGAQTASVDGVTKIDRSADLSVTVTLPNGTYEGQLKFIHRVDTQTQPGTVSITTHVLGSPHSLPLGYSGASYLFCWNGTAWVTLSSTQFSNGILYSRSGKSVEASQVVTYDPSTGEFLITGGAYLLIGSSSGGFKFEGGTSDDYETTLGVVDPTADRTILLPNLSGTLLLGPATATDNALVRFDGTSGFLIQNSALIIDDSANVTGVAALTMSGVLTVSSGGETLTITANSPANTVTYSTYPSANMVFVSGGNLDFDMYDSGTGAAKMRFLFGGADKGAYVDDLGEIVAKKFICSTGGETLTITANSPANAVTISCDPTSNLYIDSGGDMYFDIYATGAGTAKFRFTAGGSEKATIDDLGAAVFLSVSTGNGAVELYPSGTYTPTLTNVANVGASTAYSCQYHRVGDIVHVSGKVDVDPTTTLVLTQLGISLPIASNFANANECAGTAVAPAISGGTGCAAILGDATNNRAELQMTPVDVANQSFYFTFTYRVI